jgi:serine/threonine-protein kinase
VATDDATQLLTSAAPLDAATRLLTPTAATGAAVPAIDEAPPRKRSPWTWPLIALIVLLLLVLGGAVWALLANQGGGADPTGTPTSKKPSSSATSSQPAPSPTTVDVEALDLVGQDCDTARQTLTDVGLNSSCVDGTAATTEDKVGLVYEVNPSGPNVPKGTTIDLTVYASVTAMTTPGAPTIQDGGTPVTTVTAGSDVDVQWSGYSCAPGTGSVLSYNLTASNGLFSNGQSSIVVAANQRTAPIEVSANAGQSLIVSYTVTCTGGPGGDRTSPTSAEAAATITAAAPSTPTPPVP